MLWWEQNTTLNQTMLSAWLTLALTPKIGAQALSRLQSHDSLDKIVAYNSADLREVGFSAEQVQYIQHQSEPEVSRCLNWARQENHHLLIPLDGRYPALLKQCRLPPPILFVKGELAALHQPQIAMVGSRHASLEALNTARDFAEEFVNHGLVVTSGLALGIDGYAHDGALIGKGKTIAVLGSGLDNIYPSRHRNLARRIEQQGALVSEFLPHCQAKAAHFPRRNRIISGLSVGVLVVEAAEKSGSLITARYAGEQGREVFAIPGSIHHPNNRGGNQLIKSGACLVQTTQDVLEEVELLINWSAQQNKTGVHSVCNQIDEEELPFAQLLANVGVEATPVDILANRTHIPVHEVMTQLLELELLGYVVAVTGGYIRKGRGKL